MARWRYRSLGAVTDLRDRRGVVLNRPIDTLANTPGRPSLGDQAGETFDLADGPSRSRVRHATSLGSRTQGTPRAMVTAFLVSFGVIFVAELGDKSQLMALAFATRYPMVPVLIGITAATALVHAVSVLVGAALGASIPTDAITVVAGIAFLAFGVWTLRGDELTEEDERRAATQSSRSTVLTVGSVFFLAELGDKTMLATITLATQGRPVRHLARIHARHGRRRRARDRRRSPARLAPAGTRRPVGRGGRVLRLRDRLARRGGLVGRAGTFAA